MGGDYDGALDKRRGEGGGSLAHERVLRFKTIVRHLFVMIENA